MMGWNDMKHMYEFHVCNESGPQQCGARSNEINVVVLEKLEESSKSLSGGF